jgi:hypothetical protein
LALPAGTCSLMKPTIFFAMLFSLRVMTPWLLQPQLPGVNDSLLTFLAEPEKQETEKAHDSYI